MAPSDEVPPEETPLNSDRPQAAEIDSELPILVRPVPRPKLPKAITTARVLTRVQVALVMICGNCSFGLPLVVAIGWVIERFKWHEDSSVAIYWAWAIGFAAIVTYACVIDLWAGEADRRARTTIIIGTAVLVGLTAVPIPIIMIGGEPGMTTIVLIAAAPSLIVQAIVLRCVYGPEGRRWFEGERSEQVVTEL